MSALARSRGLPIKTVSKSLGKPILSKFYSVSSLRGEKVVIIGGGSAGVGVLSQLKGKDVTVVEPSDYHYFQPLWTVVGAGYDEASHSCVPMGKVLKRANPKASWIKKAVENVDAANNKITLSGGDSLSYDYLVIATGLKVRPDLVDGLQNALSDESCPVVSVYGDDEKNSIKTSKKISEFSGGNAVFTSPSTPIKCAGAPQKIMWLFEEQVRKVLNKRHETDISFFAGMPAFFAVPHYNKILNNIAFEREVQINVNHNIVAVDAKSKTATFQVISDGKNTEKVEVPFDLLHVTPPMTPPAFIKSSGLSIDGASFVSVNPDTLQSTVKENIFALGDSCNTPNSKTVAAITVQVPVVVHNLQCAMKGQPLTGKYNGYASCPLYLGKSKIILAEFGYGGKLMETMASMPWKYLGLSSYIPSQSAEDASKKVGPVLGEGMGAAWLYHVVTKLLPVVYW
eukprot:CAMPEP_0182424564 /NCGR_PEP_ID=MMETSP1167-20130531/10766_1 /TAXON_ID=2988 /ORGANISM="Mallomonas Sp, Strain CCMP3275" /LENGTH=454 /DNA_ID=CAMNT_0024604451 /DNA_START=63 /DNA_END=1424 /DNA_ORIENTATION=-